MPIVNGMNSDYINYFSLFDYVNKIKLSPAVLEHLEATNREFDNYMHTLSCYDEEYIVNYFIYSLYSELMSSTRIENVNFDVKELTNSNLFFDTLTISNRRIHLLHNFITEGEMEPSFEYRKKEVNVSKINDDGTEDIFWRGVRAKDVNRFMNNFIKIFKHNGTSLLYSNPFLASSLMHLLFIRIHPYTDGNGRTSRIVHNIKFTEMVNKLYGTNLKLSPLNLSESILLNKVTYVKRLDNIYFDMKHDTNENINAWFNFILDMADEQLFVAIGRIPSIDNRFIVNDNDIKKIRSMRLSKIK